MPLVEDELKKAAGDSENVEESGSIIFIKMSMPSSHAEQQVSTMIEA